MSRSLASAALAELNCSSTGGVWLALATITHADLASTLRLVNDRADVVSGGDTYTAFPFSVQLPADVDEAPRALLAIDAVDLTVVTAARTITSPATTTIEVIRQSAPDTILVSYSLQARSASYDAANVTLELFASPVLDESYPGTEFTPILFPAIYDR